MEYNKYQRSPRYLFANTLFQPSMRPVPWSSRPIYLSQSAEEFRARNWGWLKHSNLEFRQQVCLFLHNICWHKTLNLVMARKITSATISIHLPLFGHLIEGITYDLQLSTPSCKGHDEWLTDLTQVTARTACCYHITPSHPPPRRHVSDARRTRGEQTSTPSSSE